MLRRVVPLSLLCLFCCPLPAQQEEIMAVISEQLEELVENYVKESFLKHDFPKDVNDIRFMFGPKQVDSVQFAHAQEEQMAEIDVLRKSTGLRLQSSYGHNFKGSVFEDDGTFYQWRANTGLDWNILNGGLIHRKHQLEQKRLEYEADQAKQNEELKELSYRKSFDFIIYTFNQQKVHVIEDRLKILSELLSVVEKMYYLRYTHWEAVLDVKSKKAETELFLKNYVTYLNSIQLDQELLDFSVSSLPIFDILFEEIEIRGIDTTARHLALQKELEALEHQFHWARDVNLSAQIRYNYFQGGVTSGYNARDFFSGGLSLSVPIPFNRSANKSWKNAKQQKIKTSFDTYQKGLDNELLNHYYEYEYAHKQYVNFFYKKEQLAVTINRHIRKRNLADPDYSPMQVVDKLDELFSVDLELIDIQQKMYLKALRIFTMINAPDILPFIDVKDYNVFVSQYHIGRKLFCSAEDLKNFEVNFLIEFFKHNGVSEVIVDGGQDPDSYLKYAALLDAAVGTDLKIRFLIDPVRGSDSLAEDLETLTAMALTPLIHFDLMSALSQIPDQGYQEILETIFRYSKSNDITVTGPVNLDPLLIQALAPFITGIHLIPRQSAELAGMYYDVLRDQQNQYGSKLNLVVRPVDFGTKMEMDQFINQLTAHLTLNSIGLSSMQELIELDKKTVGWHEERRF